MSLPTSKKWQLPTLNAAGFSLVEVLVSMLVLLIGVLGAIKMQLHATHVSQQSNFYSTAVELAAEMADYAQSGFSCPDEYASCDVTDWLEHFTTSLPNPRAVICRDDAPWNHHTQNLTWQCDSSGDKTSTVIKLGWSEQRDTTNEPPPRFALTLSKHQ